MREQLKNKTFREGLAVLAAGLALGAYSLISFRRSAVQTAWILSPWLFPMLLAVFAALLGAALLGGCRETAERRDEQSAGKPDGRRARRVFITALMAAAYCALLPLIRFLPATALFLAAMMLFLGEEYHRRGWAMQLHYGALRNTNSVRFTELGPDTGYDCIGPQGDIGSS